MSVPTRCPFCKDTENITVANDGEFDREIGCMVGAIDCYSCGRIEIDFISYPDATEVVDARRSLASE